ncbi:MAG: preprotein translocase subunit SecY [Candidatus Asgardarchaeia archaeon]
MVRFIEVFRPLFGVLPEVRPPERKVSFREKIVWTFLALLLFLIMSQIPLYGVDPSQGIDYLFWMRVITASSRGSLMELGIGPIVTAGLIMQMLAGSQLINVDFSDPEDRALFTGTQKAMAFMIIVLQSLLYIMSGAYGQLTFFNSFLIFIQLVFASTIVLLLDEMIQKGWGIGSGVSLFIAANVSTIIMWSSFAPIPTGTEHGDGLYRGIIIAFFQVLIEGITNGDWSGFGKIVVRPYYLPDVLGLLSTILIFLVVVYVESIRVEIPVVHARYKGFASKYPIKLLYTSNIPVILVQALYANVLLWSQFLWNSFPDNFWVSLLGKFELREGRLNPVGGLVYYLTPPRDFNIVMQDPLRAIIYGVILITLCGFFASIWVEVAGLTPRDVARQFIRANIKVPGFRASEKVIAKLLERYIPTIALFGGFIMGFLAAFADFLGAFGTGAGILLTIDILYQYYQMIAQEQLAELHPAVRGLLGME